MPANNQPVNVHVLATPLIFFDASRKHTYWHVAQWHLHKYSYSKDIQGYDYASLLRVNEIFSAFEGQYKSLSIRCDSTVEETIREARRLFEGFDQDTLGMSLAIDTTTVFAKTAAVKYLLFCPAHSDEPLPLSTKLCDLEITDGEFLLLKQAHQEPPDVAYCLASVKDLTNFWDIVATDSNFDDRRSEFAKEPVLFSVLLYTDEDQNLAAHIRRHFDELHVMSGNNLRIYVVEEPPKGSVYANCEYWKSYVNIKDYPTWSFLGWTKSKPYAKSAVYEIARSLGIYPDQLPCMVIFYDIKQPDKIVVPISDDYLSFFRGVFGNIQRCLNEHGLNSENKPEEMEILIPQDDIPHNSPVPKKTLLAHIQTFINALIGNTPKIERDMLDKLRRWEQERLQRKQVLKLIDKSLFDTLKATLFEMDRSAQSDRTKFNFFGHTVFINQIGDQIGGDKIFVGNITDSTNIAIGKDIQQST